MGVEAYFQRLKGILDTTVGMDKVQQVIRRMQMYVSAETGHAEVCLVAYDEKILPLAKVLEHFFRIIDPTNLNRQGPDKGTQY